MRADNNYFICVEKIRDNSNNIVKYNLVNIITNVPYSMSSRDLKIALVGNNLEVVNLKLTSDNRLVDRDKNEQQQLEQEVNNIIRAKEQFSKNTDLNNDKLFYSFNGLSENRIHETLRNLQIVHNINDNLQQPNKGRILVNNNIHSDKNKVPNLRRIDLEYEKKEDYVEVRFNYNKDTIAFVEQQQLDTAVFRFIRGQRGTQINLDKLCNIKFRRIPLGSKLHNYYIEVDEYNVLRVININNKGIYPHQNSSSLTTSENRKAMKIAEDRAREVITELNLRKTGIKIPVAPIDPLGILGLL